MGIFFSKNKKTAMRRIIELSKKERSCYSVPKLAKRQIEHVDGWKTWEVKKARCSK